MRAYFRGIEMYNDALMVKVAYPNNWKAYPSDDGKINNIKGHINQDIILKLKLLKDKVEELKELFQMTSYDDLLNLHFVIEKPTKPKRKYTKKKVSKAKEEENKVEEKTEEV